MGKKNNMRNNAVPTQEPLNPTQHSNDKLGRSMYVYDLVNKWIENADNKVSVSCAVFTGVFSVITFLFDKQVTAYDGATRNTCGQCIYTLLFVASIIAMVVALLFYAISIIPNLNSNEDTKRKEYPIFYGDIQNLNIEEYKQLMDNGTEEQFIDELVSDTLYNSKICYKKMKNYKVAVIISLVAIILSFLSIIVVHL